MSARCRCYCGCERLDRALDDETSSWLMCLGCCMDRHRRTSQPRCPTCDRVWDVSMSGPYDPKRAPAWAESEGWHHA